MGKPFKRILSIFVVILFLLIAIVCTLPFVINPNNFKPEIATLVKNKTGRELVLDGELKLSLFPWVGVSTGKIALSNALAFQDSPFATVEGSEVHLLLLPLLSKKVEVSRIVLKGLVLNLAKNKQGINNWDDLIKAGENKALARSPPVVGKADQQTERPTFAIGGMTIENTRIIWDDLNTGQHLELKDFNLNTNKFLIDQPVSIAVSLSASDAQSTTIHTIKLNTELSVNRQLDIFSLRRSELQITTTGKNVPGKTLMTSVSVADLGLDMTQQTAKIEGLRLKVGDMMLSAELTGTSIKDNPTFQGPVSMAQFSPAKVMSQLAIALPAMQDSTALSKLAINFNLAATAESLALQQLVMSLDDSQVKGAIGIHLRQDQGKKDIEPHGIHFLLDIDALDVDHYLPPAEQSSKPIASPAMMLATGFSAFPAETLRKLDAEGVLTLGKLKIYGRSMQDIQLNLNSKNSVLNTQQSIKKFYQGTYVGDLRIDTQGDKPALAVNEKIDHLHIGSFSGVDQMSGIVNLSAQLQAQGIKVDDLKSTLNGQLSFLVKDSVIKGFNLQKIISEGKMLIKGSALLSDLKQDQTLFSDISGTAVITNGLIQNNDLVAQSSQLRVDGKGNLNLSSEMLNYKINAKLLNADVTAPEQVDGSVAINIGGTLTQPSYTIDLASLLSDQNKAKIEKLINKLDQKLGSGVGDLLKNFLK